MLSTGAEQPKRARRDERIEAAVFNPLNTEALAAIDGIVVEDVAAD